MIETLPNTSSFFEGNLAALKKHYPDIFSEIKGSLSSFSLSFSGQNNKSITITDNQKVITITEQQREKALSKSDNPILNEPIYLLIGLGVGDELRKVYNITELPIPELHNFKLPIYVVEPEPLLFIATLWIFDLREILNSLRVQWFIGMDAPIKFSAYFNNNRQAIYPTQITHNWYPDNHPVAHATIQFLYEASNRVNAEIYQLNIKTKKLYNNIKEAEWLDIFTSNKRPLRIMGWTSRFTSFLQYCMRDLLAGFKELGHETYMHIEASDISRTTQQDILYRINEFQPDVIIVLDHFRDEYPFIPINIPFVSWIQDLLPSVISPASRTLNPLDFIYVFAPAWVKALKRIPFYSNHKIDVLYLGINPETYYPLNEVEKDCDVLYVSHLVSPEDTLRPLINHESDLTLTNEEAKFIDLNIMSYEQLLQVFRLIKNTFDNLLIDELWKYKARLPVREPFISQILKKSDIPTNDTIIDFFCCSQRIHNDIYYAIKSRPLIALNENGIDVHIYGKNWEQVKGLSNCSYGPINNGEQLNLMMNRARICISNSPGSSLHMRALEILGSGSFMLSRDIFPDASDIKEFFTKNEEIYFFKNEVDIIQTVKHWLSKDCIEEYNSSRLMAHKKALELFDYKIIANKILNNISTHLDTTT